MTQSLQTAIKVLFVIARAMLAATFLISAIRHSTHCSAALDEMGADGMPRSSLLLIGSITLRLIGGLSILFGFYARAGAALLFAFLIPAAFLAHNFWAMPSERQTHESIEFLNNLAMAAGALLVALNGAGPWSIDAAKTRRPAFRPGSRPNALATEFK
jgi:putative oxidoreductase